MSPKNRTDIIEYINRLDDVALDKDDIQYPQPSAQAIQGLPISRDGFQCIWQSALGERCDYVCQRLQHIHRHCREQHGWQNSQRSGRPTRAAKEQAEANRMWEENVTYQRFFEYAQWKRYFRVQQVGEQANPADRSIIERGAEFLEQWQRASQEQKKKKII